MDCSGNGRSQVNIDDMQEAGGLVLGLGVSHGYFSEWSYVVWDIPIGVGLLAVWWAVMRYRTIPERQRSNKRIEEALRAPWKNGGT
jgi:hypothetical protein